MKKILVFSLALALFACARQPSMTEEKLVDITFKIADGNSGRLLDIQDTKACPEPGFVADALSASLPAGAPEITLSSKTNSAREYTVTAGQTATVAVDRYYAIGEAGGDTFQDIYIGKAFGVACYEIAADEVEITEEISEVTLDAEYTVFAVVYSKSEVKKIQILDSGGHGYDDAQYVGGNDTIGIVFFSGSWSGSQPLKIKVIPLDTVNYTEKLYTLSMSGANNTIKVRNGYWYYFGPEEVTVTEGLLNVILPEWQNGNE